MTEQTEKSYQKQAGLSSGGRGSTQFKQKGGKNMRWYKNVGLGFKTPRAAIDGNFVDKKCPFTGDVSIRGKLRSGIVKSTKVRPPEFAQPARSFSDGEGLRLNLTGRAATDEADVHYP